MDMNQPYVPVAQHREGSSAATMPIAVAEGIGKMEIKNLKRSTNRVYQFRMRHPYLYAGIAFILGGGLVVAFGGSTYLHDTYTSPNMTVAFHDLLAAGIGGGIAAALLAFGYTSTIRPTLGPIDRMSGVTTAGEDAFDTLRRGRS